MLTGSMAVSTCLLCPEMVVSISRAMDSIVMMVNVVVGN